MGSTTLNTMIVFFKHIKKGSLKPTLNTGIGLFKLQFLKRFNGFNIYLYSGLFLGNGKQVHIWVGRLCPVRFWPLFPCTFHPGFDK